MTRSTKRDPAWDDALAQLDALDATDPGSSDPGGGPSKPAKRTPVRKAASAKRTTTPASPSAPTPAPKPTKATGAKSKTPKPKPGKGTKSTASKATKPNKEVAVMATTDDFDPAELAAAFTAAMAKREKKKKKEKENKLATAADQFFAALNGDSPDSTDSSGSDTPAGMVKVIDNEGKETEVTQKEYDDDLKDHVARVLSTGQVKLPDGTVKSRLQFKPKKDLPSAKVGGIKGALTGLLYGQNPNNS